MEQYIYIFTIFLEIIICVQLSVAIIKLDKKVSAINNEVIALKDDINEAVKQIRKIISKFNRIAGLLVKIKQSKARKYIINIIDAASLFFFFKSFKTYKGIFKLRFIRKILSYSIVRTFFSYIKSFI